MKKITILLVMSLLLLFVANSCKDPLEEIAYSSFTTGKTFESIEGARMAVNGIYGPLVGEIQVWGYWKISFMDLTMGTDEAFVNPDWPIEVANYRITSVNDKIEELYEQIYVGVGRCNMCVDRIEQMSAGTATARKELISEAKTVRAIYYFDAVNFFETPSLVTNETAGYNESIFVPNSNPQAIFEQIVEDLKYASENGAEPTLKGRANKYTAMALLAKVYMYMGSEYWKPLVFDDPGSPMIDGVSVYQLAVDMADAVISGPYSLQPATDGNDYGEIFLRSTQDASPEVILTLNFDENKLPTKYGAFLAPNWEEAPSDGNQWDPRNGKYWYSTELGWPSPVSQFLLSFHDNDIRFGWDVIPGLFQKDKTFKFYPSDGWRCGKYRAEGPFAWGSDVAPVYIRLADIYLIKAEALNELQATPSADAYDALNEVRRRAKVPEVSEAYLEALNPHDTPDLLWGMQSGNAYLDDSEDPAYPGRHEYYTNALIETPTLKDKFRAAIMSERGWELCYERQRWLDSKRWRLLEKILGPDAKLKYVAGAKFKDEFSNMDPFMKNKTTLENAPEIVFDRGGLGAYAGQGGNGFVLTFDKTIHYYYPIPLSALNSNSKLKQNFGY